MSDWVLIPCLKQLFAAFNSIAPNRDKASDGAIGDTAHQQEVSDHNPDETGSVPIHDADHVNEVHAIDVDNNLNESDLTMEKVVQFLLGRCRSGAEKRLRYIIYNRRIWSASSGWVQKAYTGASPHTEHAHFSASYDTNLEASTASWHLEDIPVALTDADKNWLTNMIRVEVKANNDDAAKIVRLEAHTDRSTPFLSDVDISTISARAAQALLDAKVENARLSTDGTPWDRTVGMVLADGWCLDMNGKTMGLGNPPSAGVPAQLLKDLDDMKAQIAQLTSLVESQA